MKNFNFSQNILCIYNYSHRKLFLLTWFFIYFYNFSDENTAVNHSGVHSVSQVTTTDGDGWRRPRSESSADAESVYMTNAVLSDSGYGHGLSRRSSVSIS